MRFSAYINGFYNDVSEGGEVFQAERIRVLYTADAIGKTLSVCSEKHHIQMTIPFDGILKMIKEGDV